MWYFASRPNAGSGGMLWQGVVGRVLNLNYLTIDVFTDRPFGGSRLTLFPDGDKVPREQMQMLAMEMGCGETAFVLPGSGERSHIAALRVFTPTVEIPFAGHSVLGATFAMDRLGQLKNRRAQDPFTWKLEAGSFKVFIQDSDRGTIYSLLNDPPAFLGQYFQRGKVARTLGIDEDEIAITGLPCEIISTGLPIHIVPVSSLDVIQSIHLRQREADAIARDLGFGDLFVFTCETVYPESDVHCRMFAPHFGIPEDPASGSATGSLAAYLIKHRLIKLSERVRIVSEQGLEMGRPSRLIVEAEVSGGQATRIQVGGQCVLVGQGTIELSDDLAQP
jgi:trans-2,3-dihydro-3-hydroxyanthranilate isomerase